MSEPDITGFVCGGDLCADGLPHDSKEWVDFDGGGSAVCSRCGSAAIDRDILRLP